jgi:uncharacterized protein YdcH (DUF465 family)
MDEGFITEFNNKIEQLSRANIEFTNKVKESNDFNADILKGLSNIDGLVKKINEKIQKLKNQQLRQDQKSMLL